MDPSRICLLRLSLEKQWFNDYKTNKNITIGLNLKDLDKILKRSNADDNLEFSFEEKEQKLKIKMRRDGFDRTRIFSLALLDIDIEVIPIDNLLSIKYPSKWVIDTELFIEAIKDGEIYSDHMHMEALKEDQMLVFSSMGQIGEMVYELGLGELKTLPK